jgi:hypothetical protein
MKKSFVLVLALLLAFAAGAAADVSIAGHSVSDGPYLGARGLGIGIVLGTIDGLSVKSWISRDHALQFDLNWDLNYGAVGFGAAYLIHNFHIIEADNNKFPLYFGIKGWAALAPGGAEAGIQVPLGIAWIPRNAPIDIFAQVEPGISLIPSVHSAMGGGIGIRFWLN